MPDNPSETVVLAQSLIKRPSVTPDDAGCQPLIAKRLQAAGFTTENLPFGDVNNLWAVYGTSGPLFVFAGHTDVVPVGDLAVWKHPPFGAVIENGLLYGRGAADMKSSIAAMVIATERLLNTTQIKGRIGLLITSDEEGPAVDGTVKVVEHLQQSNVKPDWCIVGEPTSTTRLGDIIKNGRRGSMNGELVITGKQGHVAYPHLADNPIHRSTSALHELCEEKWDNGDEYFPPTTFQISNVNAGTGAENVIPGDLVIKFNFRFSTQSSTDELQNRVVRILEKHGLTYQLHWRISGQPFITEQGKLVNATVEAIEEVCGITAELSTSGGTSDGRFIATSGAEVLELGPRNDTIHQANECVSCADLDTLTRVYENVMRRLLT